MYTDKIVPFLLPARVITAINAAERCLLDEVKQFKAKKVLVVSDEMMKKTGMVDTIAGYLTAGDIEVHIYTDVEPEPSLENLETGVEFMKQEQFDLVVALGGGSVMDVAKLMAVLVSHDGEVRSYIGSHLLEHRGIPTIVLPTTSGTGSEVTINAVFRDVQNKNKKVAVSPYIMPDVAIIDPVLTLSVPPSVTAASGMDALTHAIEAYTALKATPQADLYAIDAIERIGKSLRTAVANGSDIEARYEMSLGSLFGGIANGVSSVGAVHALSYPLGAEYHLPHGVSNALMLPHVMKKNIIGNVERFGHIARLLGENTEGLSPIAAAERALTAVEKLSEDVGIPKHLRDFNIPKEIIPEWAKKAIETQQRLLTNNPRKLTEKDIAEIYESAW